MSHLLNRVQPGISPLIPHQCPFLPKEVKTTLPAGCVGQLLKRVRDGLNPIAGLPSIGYDVLEMLISIFLVYSPSGITSGKKSLSSSKWRPFWKFWNIKHSFNLTSNMKRSSEIMPKKFFYGDDVIDDFRSKLQGQCLVNKCQYHNCLSRLYMPKDDLSD